MVDLEEWLPITASRKAKWWNLAFHNISSMVGIGVLGLPHAMSRLEWGVGGTILIISWIITLYTRWQMVEMHEMVPGKRFDRYHELGQHAFGEKLGLWLVVPQQLVAEIGLDIVYLVTGGNCLKKFHYEICPNCKDIVLTYFIIIFSSAHFLLAQLPNLNSISVVSLAAAVMSLSYSTIAWGASVDEGRNQIGQDKATAAAGKLLEWGGALGVVAFAYSGHILALEIQATAPSTPETPSKKPTWKGTVVAYIIIAVCYFPMAFVGYWIFGKEVEGDILDNIEKHRGWFFPAVNMMVVVHNIGSYQLYAMPVFDLIETVLIKKLELPQGLTLRFVARTFYVAFTMFMAIAFPFFSGLLDFFGGFALLPSTYLFPCIMWLAIYKPRRFSLSWITNWICIVFGVLFMIISTVCGFWKIVTDGGTYKLYSWIK